MSSAEPSVDLRRKLVGPLRPALELGAVSGVTGFVGGGVAGIFTSATPTLFAVLSGAQWFFLGTTFFYCRGTLLGSVLHERTKSKEVAASGMSGALAGAALGALRNRTTVVPGAIMLGLMGMTGQATYHAVAAPSDTPHKSRTMLDRIADARWLPLRSLPDAEYEKLLDEKVISIKAEVALIDEQISALQQAKSKLSNSVHSTNR